MKRLLAIVAILAFVLACAESEKPKPLSVKGETLYTLKGKILSRNTTDNTINVDHDAIPGFMEAMTMDYSVRGTTVDKLPADGSRIEAKLHVLPDAYWLTDIKQVTP